MKYFEVNGFYGSQKTPCTVLVRANFNGSFWYVVEGSVNVNRTYDAIEEGVNVETLQDVDTFTWSKGVHNLDELEKAIES